MASPRREFDLLLEAPTSVEADMAREVLGQAGIPTYLHGRDRDLAQFGVVAHNNLTRPDLYVPKGRRGEAQAILDETWDAKSLTDQMALGAGDDDGIASPTPESRRRLWAKLLALVAIVGVLWMCYREFIGSHAYLAP
jgi:hypothetical protein